VEFYTLYGHLSRTSIKDLNKNTQITKNQCIGYLGDFTVNGDYAPHLHFQIMKDIEDYEGDYPGVCSQNNLAFYSANCPDPNLVLKLC
jgi:murein DD-endopeptidase MepM/ murein hydrolase activator NlpD